MHILRGFWPRNGSFRPQDGRRWHRICGSRGCTPRSLRSGLANGPDWARCVGTRGFRAAYSTVPWFVRHPPPHAAADADTVTTQRAAAERFCHWERWEGAGGRGKSCMQRVAVLRGGGGRGGEGPATHHRKRCGRLRGWLCVGAATAFLFRRSERSAPFCADASLHPPPSPPQRGWSRCHCL